MKRSEIILNIANYLCKEEYGEETVEIMRSSIENRLMRQAAEIIDRIEDAGMAYINGIHAAEWEPEDERYT